MRFLASIRTRLIFSHVLVSLVSILLISISARSYILNAARNEFENNLKEIAFASRNDTVEALRGYLEGQNELESVSLALEKLLSKHSDIRYTVYLLNGIPIIDSEGDLTNRATVNNLPEVFLAIRDELGQTQRVRRNTQGDEVLSLALLLSGQEQNYGVLRLEADIQPALASAYRSASLLGLASVLITLAVMLFAWLLAENLSRPIQELTQAATQLAGGDLETRVQPSGAQEVQHLGQAFNLMAGRLQNNVNELRSFVANASHELRTPLTIVKLRVEALRGGAKDDPGVAERFLEDIESEVDRLARMVNDLLDLSRMEAGLTVKDRAFLDLGTVASEVYESFTIRAERAGVKTRLVIEPGLPPVEGDEGQLRRVFYNLLDNAIKFSPPEGVVELSVLSGKNRRSIRLMVKDSGPGIAAEHLPHIFERFYRVDATRPRHTTTKGSGLGLAIAKSIVENHGGQIGVSSQPGKGSTFWAELPTIL
jgi:signal transduction histidine kinase